MYMDGLVLSCIICRDGNTVFTNLRMHLPIHVLITVNISMQDFVRTKLKFVKYWERGHFCLGFNLSIRLCEWGVGVYFLGGGHLQQCVSNHRQLDSLFNMLFQTIGKENIKAPYNQLLGGESSMTSGFHFAKASNMENCSMSWHHYNIGTNYKHLTALLCHAGLKGNLKQLNHQALKLYFNLCQVM